MAHSEIWKKFKERFDPDANVVECWFPNGKNSVRIRLKEGGDIIFTYKSKKVWKVETVDSYLEGIKVKVTK